MLNLTTDFRTKLIDGLTSVTQLTTPSVVYVALFTSDPTEAGDVSSEISNVGYTRIALTSKFTSTISDTSSNTDSIVFPEADENWDIVTHMGFMSSSTLGDTEMLMFDELSNPVSVLKYESLMFDIGTLELQIT